MAPPDFLFETDRLGIKPADPTVDDDVRGILSIFQTDAAAKAFGDGVKSTTFESCKKRLQQRWDELYLVRGYGSFLAFRKPTSTAMEPQLVGGFSVVMEEGADFPDIGFALLDEAIGQGYAMEAVQGLIEHCRANCGLKDVTAFTRAYNEASRKLMERIGLRLIVTVTVTEHDADQEVVVYALGDDAESRGDEYYKNVVQKRLSRMHR